MGMLVISENMTLDGVMQDPTGDDGFERGGWFGQVTDEDHQAWAEVECGEALRAQALLMGRRSYEYLVERWPGRTGTWADRLNSMPKYVVSSTLMKPVWSNTTVITGEVVDAVSRLKHYVEGEIVVNASGQLVPLLIEHDLVDEVRLMVFPFVLGGGERLFGATSATKALRLVDTRIVGAGLALLTYSQVRVE
ncbi:deaminase [Nocardioides guangzhouensis]|uniref:Deaminase n=2 Tax=Nocardioides guangzhouensis TaxID=2497878 RepID=A0A4Q4ZJV8_9ACTN|nr:deaminase [Nocardioides guangzhouensis]